MARRFRSVTGRSIASAAPRVGVAPKSTDPHYGTQAHKAWAAEVKRRARYRCEGEGCGASDVPLIADHITELVDAPELALDPANGRALCASCHGRKTHQARQTRFSAY